MTFRPVFFGEFDAGRYLLAANWHRVFAPSVESAAGGWIGGRWDVTLEQNPVWNMIGIGDRDSRKQSLCVRMLRIRI